MSAEQIASMLRALEKEFEAGNIGMWNYKKKLQQAFGLAAALADRVALLEEKENQNG